MLILEKLREILHYDEVTGVFTWKRPTSKRTKAGMEAGTAHSKGYLVIKIEGRLYFAHRLAWFYVYGSWPSKNLDHINRQKTDNRVVNLREVTNSENAQNRLIQSNNTSGFRGVSWHKRDKLWYSRIVVDGKARLIGVFKTPEQAGAAYKEAALKMHTHQPEVQT